MSRLLAVPVLAASLLLVAGCGAQELDRAADTSTCAEDAQAVSSYPPGFPAHFPFPPRTVVYHAEDRGQDGVVVTGVSTLPFKEVLASFNGPAQRAGYKVTDGETEEHDAEADWAGNGYRGRWAIRESADCAGQTVVQVLSAKS
ncbi:MAG TPA: hypothetical protein VFL69_01945 [Marmoricola sp.]|nr:hypothetical protein [Marmoricola sp.]